MKTELETGRQLSVFGPKCLENATKTLVLSALTHPRFPGALKRSS